MADEQSSNPLIHQLEVAQGGRAVVAGVIEHLHVHQTQTMTIDQLDLFATVPPLPPSFIPRLNITDPIVEDLLNPSMRAAAAIEGMGGVGKTIVANEICHDPRIRQVFRDGVLWFSIGKQRVRTPEDLTREMALHLNREFKVYSAAAYRSLFVGKSILVILDDVWSLEHLEPFLLETGSSRLIFTSRNRELASAVGANCHEVGVLDTTEARIFLAQRTGQDLSRLPEPQTTGILSGCHGLVLALAMVGAALKSKAVEDWERLHKNLSTRRITETGFRISNYGYKSISAALSASIDELSPLDRARYSALAVLLRDMPFSEALLQQVWNDEEDDAHAAMARLVDHSLASLNAKGELRLHDLQFDFICSQYTSDETLRLIHLALEQSLHVVLVYPEQFRSQMAGRLMSQQSEPGIKNFLESLRPNRFGRALRVTSASLEQAGSTTRRILKGHYLRVIAVAMSRDGHHAVSAGHDGKLCLWDLAHYVPPLVIDGHPAKKHGGFGRITSVAISADGKRVIAGSSGKILQVVDIGPHGSSHLLEGHTAVITSLAISADGKRAISGSGNVLRIWDLHLLITSGIFEGHTSTVEAVALSANDEWVVSGSRDCTVRVWNLAGRSFVRLLEGHTAAVNAVAISGDGTRTISGSDDMTLRVWDTTGQKTYQILRGHTDRITHVGLSLDGNIAISGSDDMTLRVWDLVGGVQTKIFYTHDRVSALALRGDAKQAITGSFDPLLRVWDLMMPNPSSTAESHTKSIRGVALSADGKRAISGSDDKTVGVWNLIDQCSPIFLEGHADAVTSVALSADGKRAVSGSRDRTLCVWNLDTHAPPRILEGHSNAVNAVALSQDGKMAVSGSADTTLRLWDLDGPHSTRIIGRHHGDVSIVAINTNGKQIFSAHTHDRTLRTWDVEMGTSRMIHQFPIYGVKSIALSSDGKYLFSSHTQEINVFDLQSLSLVRTIGCPYGLNSISLSPDNRRLVLCFDDHTLRVWDLESGVNDSTFTCERPILCCSWRGEYVVGGDTIGRLHILKWLE